MSNLKTVFIWLCQFGICYIFLNEGFSKIKGDQMAIETFAALNMEPTGRYIIGICEMLAGILVLHPQSAAIGAFLGVGVLTGALFAHIGTFGFADTEMLWGAFVLLFIVLWARRASLPFAPSRMMK